MIADDWQGGVPDRRGYAGGVVREKVGGIKEL
jgi:hypothetical protein